VIGRIRTALGRRGRAAPEPECPLKGGKGIKRASASTEAFFRTDGPHTGPLLVVYHIQKTAGTAFRQIVRTNLPPADVEITPDLRDLRYEPAELLRWYRDWYLSLDHDRRARLCCVMSHSAGYLLPALDRPAEALVLVREPVDRVLSFYHEKRRNYLRDRDPNTPFNLLKRVYSPPSAKGPPQAWPQFFNWQSRCLLSVFYDISELPATAGPPPDAELWRERLRKLVGEVFFVGVQDRLPDYVDSVARRFGWADVTVPRAGVNTERPPMAEGSASQRETILAHNWLDTELYELCGRAQELREAEERGSSRPVVRILPGSRPLQPSKVSEAGSTPSLAHASDAQAAAEYRSALEHRLKYLVPVDEPLVLIAQAARSGGTLQLRLFDGHRQCHVVPYELQQIFRGMASDLSDRERAWEHLARDKQYNRSRPFLLRPGLQRAIFEACLGELSDPEPREVMNCFFTSYFNGWLDNANLRSTPKRWVVGFGPGETTKLGAHARLYPDGRVISVVRDPWGWYASRRRNRPEWQDREFALDSWCAHVGAALGLQAEKPDRALVVLFSDLLGRTEATMRTLSAWLGIDFDPTLVVPSFNGMAVPARSSFRDVGTVISTVPLHRGSELTPEDTSYIDERARGLYEQAVASAAEVEPGPAPRLG